MIWLRKIAHHSSMGICWIHEQKEAIGAFCHKKLIQLFFHFEHYCAMRDIAVHGIRKKTEADKRGTVHGGLCCCFFSCPINRWPLQLQACAECPFLLYRGIRDLAEGSKLYDLKRHHNVAGCKTQIRSYIAYQWCNSCFHFYLRIALYTT